MNEKKQNKKEINLKQKQLNMQFLKKTHTHTRT